MMPRWVLAVAQVKLVRASPRTLASRDHVAPIDSDAYRFLS